MSAEAVGHVWRHAPYRGAELVVLLAVADLVSDGHENLCFMSLARLAEKARVDRDTARKAVRRLEADGWLEAVERSQGGRPSRYRFLYDERRHVHFEARSRLSTGRALGGTDSRASRGLPPHHPRDTPAASAGPTNPRGTQPEGNADLDSLHPALARDAGAQRAVALADGTACSQCLATGYDVEDDPDPRKPPRSVPCRACAGTGRRVASTSD